MERSLTVDLPVEQVAKVVKRHLVLHSLSESLLTTSQIPRYHRRRSNNHHSPSSTTAPRHAAATSTPIYSAHFLLPGGAIVDEIYKWTERVENQHLWRRQRAESISLPAIRNVISDPALQTLKQPGGFRRHFVLSKAARQGKRPPNFLTSSFVEFLCLYGHFGGEDLSDSDDDDDEDDSSLSWDDDDEEEEEEDEDEEEEEDQYSDDNRQKNTLPLPVTTSGPSSSSRSYRRYHHSAPLQYHALQARETMPLMPRTRPGQVIQPRATPGKAMFLLLKSFVTTGIMFLPRAFYNGGLLFSIAGIIGWALISLWSFLLLVQTRLVIHASFGDMGGVLYGPRMKRAVLIAITLSQIGFVCAYMVFVAENLQALLLAFSKCRVLIPMHLLILAQSFAFIPLAMIRKIQRLSVFALIADVFIVIGLLYLFYYDIQRLTTVGVGNITYWNSVQFPLFIGTVAFTYEGIGLVIPITESMKEPRKFPGVLRRTLAIITVLFISLGATSYLAFGDDVQTIILLNLPSKDPMVSSIQALYSLAICLSIPLQLFPAIRIMENGLFTTRSGKNNAVVKWQKNVFRVLIVFLCAWIAIVGSKDKLDKFVSLIGALFCIPLCFIFPPLFHMKALTLPLMRRIADIALIAFGVLCMITVIGMTVHEWNTGDLLDPVKQCIAHRS